MPTITCARCGLLRDQQLIQLFKNDIGQRAFETICADCWGEWLKHQQALINHYSLNLREPKAKEFLFQQMEQFLFTSAPQS